jgi:hypothetical protein
VEIDVDGVYENVDRFSDAISEAEAVDATITAFCAEASNVKALCKLKTFSGSTESNEPLLRARPGTRLLDSATESSVCRSTACRAAPSPNHDAPHHWAGALVLSPGG